MANRATKSGINADMKKKLDANYPHEDEAKVRAWMKDVLAQKEHQVELSGDFFDELHDGSILCQLLNSLQPGLVKGKFEKPTTMPFKQLETIGMFLEGCKSYGMPEKDLFVTLDLHEKCNKNMVIASLVSLGRQAQKNGFEGPTLGPKEAESNPREFSEEQLKEGRNVSSLQMGTNKVAHQGGMTPYGQGRQIADTRTV